MAQQRVGPYRLLKKLGAGGFGSVHLAREMGTTKTVVIKAAHRNVGTTADILQAEARVCGALRHPNVTKLLGSVSTEGSGLVLVFEQAIGDLVDHLQGPLLASEIRSFSWQLLAGLAYCSSLHIVHRDIKPDNLLIFDGYTGPFSPWTLKLADFGFARQYSPTDKKSMSEFKRLVGTDVYMPPEMLFRPGQCAVLESGDLWAAGCTIASMATGGRPIFWGTERKLAGDKQLPKDMRQVIYAICEVLGTPSASTCSWLPREASRQGEVFEALPKLRGKGVHSILPDWLPLDLSDLVENLLCYSRSARRTGAEQFLAMSGGEETTRASRKPAFSEKQVEQARNTGHECAGSEDWLEHKLRCAGA